MEEKGEARVGSERGRSRDQRDRMRRKRVVEGEIRCAPVCLIPLGWRKLAHPPEGLGPTHSTRKKIFSKTVTCADCAGMIASAKNYTYPDVADTMALNTAA